MTFRTYCKRFYTRWFGAPRARIPAQRVQPFRPWAETLEDRTVPAPLPLNHAPVGIASTVAILEDTPKVFNEVDYGFSDPQDTPANAFAGVYISNLAIAGTFTNNGDPVQNGAFVSAANIAEGLLIFTPAPDANGPNYASYDFQVRDDGGGVDTDPTPRAMTIDVTPVNDAPSFTAPNPPTVDENPDLVTIPYWATFNPGGGADEDGQTPTYFVINVSNLALVTTYPMVAPDGTLTYAIDPLVYGNSTFQVYVQDSGGTDNNGVNQSEPQTFTINVVRTITWTGLGEDGRWNNAANWSYNLLPGAYDDVVIDIPGITITIAEPYAVTIRSLQCAANLNVAGSLTLTTGESWVDGAFSMTGSIIVQGLELALRSGGSLSGTLAVANGSQFILALGVYFSENLQQIPNPTQGDMVIGTGGVAVLDVAAGPATVLRNLELHANGTIRGAGTLEVTNRFVWDGGRMEGAGMTRNLGTMTISNSPTLDRNLENTGIMNWVGSANSEWGIDPNTVITNKGTFNITAGAGQRNYLRGDGVNPVNGLVINTTDGVIQISSENVYFSSMRLENHGQLLVNSGKLELSYLTCLNTGTMTIVPEAGRIVFGEMAAITLDPNINDTEGNMLLGAGWFVCDAGNGRRADAGRVIVPEAAWVWANNVWLKYGRLEGSGTFQVHHLWWTNGRMQSDEGTPSGVTKIGSDDVLTIEQDGNAEFATMFLSNRRIEVQGKIDWQYSSSGILQVDNGGNFLIDHGTVNIYGACDIVGADEQVAAAGSFALQNGAFLNVFDPDDPTVEVHIGIPSTNNNSTVFLWGDAKFGSYNQIGSSALLIMHDNYYQFGGPTMIEGGSVELLGGNMAMGVGIIGGGFYSGVIATLTGTITGPLFNRGAQIHLAGDLTVTASAFSRNFSGDIHLNGHQLSMASNRLFNGGTLFLGNGTFVGQISNFEPNNGNAGTISGSGSILGNVSNTGGGSIIVGGDGAIGVITINGSFTQDATSTIYVEIAGRAAGQTDTLNVSGTVQIDGRLVPSLLNGFLPDPAIPDVFTVITYCSRTGVFPVDSYFMGDNILLDFDLGDSAVTMTAYWMD